MAERLASTLSCKSWPMIETSRPVPEFQAMRLPRRRITVGSLLIATAVAAALFVPLRATVRRQTSVFARETGLAIPASAAIVAAGDTHVGFHGDGYTHLVFDADTGWLGRTLAGPPPWGESWSPGPVDPFIPHPFKGGSPPVRGFPDRPAIRYSARARSSGHHNGELLAIDPLRGRVWFVSWDY